MQLLCSVVGETLSGGKNSALGNSLKDFANRVPPKVPSDRGFRREEREVGDADGGAGDLSIDRHQLFDDEDMEGGDEGSESRGEAASEARSEERNEQKNINHPLQSPLLADRIVPSTTNPSFLRSSQIQKQITGGLTQTMTRT